MIDPLRVLLLCLSAQSPVEDTAQTADVDPDAELFALEEELVETASRASDPIRLAPASVTVITADEKRNFAHNTVVDAIAGVRGLYPSDDRTNATIGVRGVSSLGLYGNRIQMQLDGHVLNEDWAGGSFSGLDLLSDLDQIERIEIVRGTGSALFGSGAMLGVVNLVTPQAPPPYAVRAGASTSLSGLTRLHADGGGTLPGGIGFWLSMGVHSQAPADVELPSYAGTPWAPDGIARDVGSRDGGTLYGRAWWGDASMSFYAHRSMNQLAAANYGTVVGDQRNHEGMGRSFVELRYEPVLVDGVRLLTRAYADYTAAEGRYVYADRSYNVSTETYEGGWGGAEARAILTLIEALRLAVGVDAQSHALNREYGVATPEPAPYLDESHPFHTGSLYANADWDPLSWLRLSGGLRLDGWFHQEVGTPNEPLGPRFWGAVNPRAAIILLPTDSDTVKIMAGRAFRAPTILELTYNDGDYTQTRNPDLQPETVTSGEVEYTRALPFDSRFIASFYALAITEVIGQVGTADESDPLRYENGSEPLVVAGGELEVVHALRDDLFASASYSYARARIGNVVDGDHQANSPTHLGALKATYAGLGPAARISSRLVVESGRTDRLGGSTEGHVVWDATLAGDVEGLSLDYAVSLRNILDQTVAHPVSADIQERSLVQPGRDIFFTVRFHL